MKPIFLIVLASIALTPQAHALFGHVAAERERRIEAQNQLREQRQSNQHLYVAVSVLSAGVVIALLIGAAAGSKTRREVNTP